MSGLKDWTKVIVIALVTALVTQLVIRSFTNDEKLDGTASKEDLIALEKDSNAYTDKSIKEHEEKEQIKYIYLVNTINEMNKMVKEIYEKTIQHEVKINDPAFKARIEEKETKYSRL
ncbi:MAG: hypothetical protein GY679_04350 [Mycoplasma sp.]|nr:hypothetical protein [Mycoplasma sp.]